MNVRASQRNTFLYVISLARTSVFAQFDMLSRK